MATQMVTHTSHGPHLRLVLAPAAHYIVHCPRPFCVFCAEAEKEWEAVQALADHLCAVHIGPSLPKGA